MFENYFFQGKTIIINTTKKHNFDFIIFIKFK